MGYGWYLPEICALFMAMAVAAGLSAGYSADKIAKEFVAAFNGGSDFLQEKSAREMATPVDRFHWTGLGVFIAGEDVLMTQGWGENGQCMMKMNCRTGAISVVMTNRNPDMEQSESGVEWLVNRRL